MFRRFHLTKLISAIAMLAALNACSSGDNSTAGTTKAVTQMPQAALTVPVSSNLSAVVIVDGNSAAPIAMTLDTGAGTASVDITGLSKASHSIQIVYRYNDGDTTYSLAQSSVHNVDLSGGSSTLNVPASDYDIASFDDDSDGLSNALELSLGTNPGDSGCVLGISLVGSCTL